MPVSKPRRAGSADLPARSLTALDSGSATQGPSQDPCLALAGASRAGNPCWSLLIRGFARTCLAAGWDGPYNVRMVLPLRDYRLARGWTLDDVARRLVALGQETDEDRLGATAKIVGRWERGEHRPGPPYPKLLCVLFQATAEELGILGRPHNAGLEDHKAQLCGRLEDVDRRDVLRLLSLALGAPVLLRGEADADRLAHALGRPSRADHEAAAIVEAAIANARRLDDVSGSRVSVRPALAQRDVIRDLLRGRPPEPVAQRLIVAGAEVAQLLGFLARSMNDHATSRRYLGEALELAQEAGDEALGAYVLGHLSMAVRHHDPAGPFAPSRDGLHEGLAFIQAAASRSETKGSAATRSWVASAEAEVLSQLGNPVAAERALDRARVAFDQFHAEEEPPWMYYYDQGFMEGNCGLVYLALDRPEHARRSTELALDGLDPAMVRDRAVLLAALAETHVAAREAEEACRLASEAVTLATHTQCNGAVLRVRQLRGQLEPWAPEPMVRELDDQLASTRGWLPSA